MELDVWIPSYNLAIEYQGKKNEKEEEREKEEGVGE
jgi:hypothetical protein